MELHHCTADKMCCDGRVTWIGFIPLMQLCVLVIKCYLWGFHYENEMKYIYIVLYFCLSHTDTHK